MKKNTSINYVAVLPRELRPLQSINCLLQISDATLSKLAEPERREEKAKKFPKKRLFR